MRRTLGGIAVFVIAVFATAGIAAASGSADAPGGNNGTVKIDGNPVDDGPNNEPHVGCPFDIDWYGFDAGQYNATVSFEAWAPTADSGLQVSEGDLTVPISVDHRTAGNQFDATERYALSFTGTPQPQQGFHVKVTVTTPYSKGADVKHKVFWVTGCTAPQVAASQPASPQKAAPQKHAEVEASTESAPAHPAAATTTEAAVATPAATPAASSAQVLGISVTRAAPPAASAIEESAAPASLARTGAPIDRWLMAAAALLLLGVLAVLTASVPSPLGRRE